MNRIGIKLLYVLEFLGVVATVFGIERYRMSTSLNSLMEYTTLLDICAAVLVVSVAGIIIGKVFTNDKTLFRTSLVLAVVYVCLTLYMMLG